MQKPSFGIGVFWIKGCKIVQTPPKKLLHPRSKSWIGDKFKFWVKAKICQSWTYLLWNLPPWRVFFNLLFLFCKFIYLRNECGRWSCNLYRLKTWHTVIKLTPSYFILPVFTFEFLWYELLTDVTTYYHTGHQECFWDPLCFVRLNLFDMIF